MAERTIEDFYGFLWPAGGETEERKRLLESLDEPIGGASDDFLLELARQWMPDPRIILDAGCGRGNHSVRLAEGNAFVIAMDPVMSSLGQIRGRAEEAKTADRVMALAGTFEQIPLADSVVDFIWCRDSLNHAGSLERAFQESARVLMNSGRLLIYCAVATPLLEPGEAERFCEPLGINSETLSQEAIEHAAAATGFHAEFQASTSDTQSLYFEDLSDREGRDVMRLARLIRMPARYEERFGAKEYRLLLALYTWRAYWTIGKLRQHVWIFSKSRGIDGRR